MSFWKKTDSKKENLNMLSLVLETELACKCSWRRKQSHFSLVTSEPCQSGFHLHIICRLKEGEILTPVCLPTPGMHLHVLPTTLVMPQKQFSGIATPHPVQATVCSKISTLLDTCLICMLKSVPPPSALDPPPKKKLW